MNAFKRMILVPEDQYKSCLLKSVPDYDLILKSTLPHHMKLNIINKLLYDKTTKQPDVNSILNTNLPENLKLNLINHLSENTDTVKPSLFGVMHEEPQESFITYQPKDDPPKQETPAKNEFTKAKRPGSPKNAMTFGLREIKDFISPSGAVFSKDNADYVKGSDITAIVKFLTAPSFGEKAPNGTKEVLKRIIIDRPQLIDYIKNTKYKEVAEEEYKKALAIKSKYKTTPQQSSFGKWLNY